MKSIISIRNSKTSSPSCLNINDNLITDPPTIATSFNDYFTSIADNIRKTIPNSRKQFSSFLKNPVHNSLFFFQTDTTEVSQMLSSLDTNKSSGPYSIPSQILPLITDHISAPLAKIFNLSFSCGIFPNNLKIAKVIPVHKKESPLELTNYRPISILSNIEKVFEKLIYCRVYEFLKSNKVLYKEQFGFRKGYSTSQTLLNITQKIMDALDKGQFACGVFIDLQKAFDTVDHEILLKKLYHYGIRGTPLSLFRSYLFGRRQFVSIAGSKSSYSIIRHGVPQGSVLGPLLFLLYINDLHYAIKFSMVHHFADDTNILHINESPKQLAKHINIDLKLLCNWLNANKISLNKSKTEYIIFKSPQKPLNYDIRIYISGTRLYPSYHIKYLGVTLDSDLSWKTQINNNAIKLKRANGALAKIRHFIPRNVLLLVYYAIFHSHLQYCCQIWGQQNSLNINRISVLQNHALRLMSFSAPRTSAKKLYSDLKVLKFLDIVHLENMLLLYNLSKGRIHSNILNTFAIDFTHKHDTRAFTTGLVNNPSVKSTNFGLHSVRYHSINSLKEKQTTLNRNLFSMYYFGLKSELKDLIIESY